MPTTPLAPEQTPEGWSGVATAYARAVAPRFEAYAASALDATRLQPGERALDIASGPGTLALLAARRGARVVATDFAPEMVARLRERAAQANLAIEAEEMDAHALRFAAGSFDAAYCAFGLMFFHDRPKALAEMRRVLRDGGRVGILTWGAPERNGSYKMGGEAFARAFPDAPPQQAEVPRSLSLSDPETLASALRDAGFAGAQAHPIVKEMDMGPPEHAWRDFASANIAFPAMVARIGEQNMPRLQRAFEEVAREHARDGTVRVEAEALLATGVK